jgi:predicted Fe-Mo cluster-binding NifX family protein
MYIAVAADGIDLKSKVSDNFVSCKYLMIVIWTRWKSAQLKFRIRKGNHWPINCDIIVKQL